MALCLQVEDISNAIKQGAKWMTTTLDDDDTGDNPLSLALYRKSQQLVEVICKRMSKYIIPNFPYSA